ncbi:MAG: efflux RND transporter periplasmic adaptor subunit [Chloroflexi bacterium]|nr:efflux RND transporter periplasmic adaptor subunit [Chloroflexota bacterium]
MPAKIRPIPLLRRLAALLLVLAVSIAVGYLGYQRLTPAAAPALNTVPTRTGTIAATVSANGTLVATRQAKLTFGASAPLAELTVNLGDRVKAGQALGRLDSAQLQSRLAQAQSSLRVSKVKLEQLVAGSDADDVAAAQASYDSAVAKLTDLKKGPSAADLRSAESAVETAVANLQTARAKLEQLRAGPTESDLRAAEQAVASAQSALVKAQNEYNRLASGADPIEVLAAERALEQARNSLWATQIDRDATCGRGKGPSCDSANVRIANSETAVTQAAEKLAQVKAGPKPEDVAAAQQSLESAKAGLAAAQARLDQVKSGATAADIQAAQSSVQSAQASYDSALARLSDLKAGTKPADIQAAEAQVASARAALNQRKSGAAAGDVAIAEEQVKQAELALKQAELDLANATLTAPFDGVVAAIGGNVGEAASAAFVAIVDPTALRVDVAVDENDVGKLQVGQPVSLTFESRPDLQVTGKVSAVSPLGVTQQGVVTYPVAITLQRTPENLPAGITANANVVVAQRDGVLLALNRAIRTAGRNRVVTVKNGDQTEDRVVQVGLTNDQFSEIVSGLSEGDLVVIPTTTTRTPSPGGPGLGGPGLGVPVGGPQFFVGGRP